MATVESESRVRLLHELACAFAERLELDELLPYVIERCREALAGDGVSLLLLDAERGELYFPYVAEENPQAAARLREVRISAERGVAGAVLKSGRPERIADVSADPRFLTEIDARTGTTTQALLAAPLVHHGSAIGVVEVVRRVAGRPFSAEDQDLLQGLAASIAVAIENARLWARLRSSEERLRARVGVLQSDLARRDRAREILGHAASLEKVLRLMESAAASPISVLLEGETGTGKELVARGIHRASVRAEGPFVPVNCAALPESLLESELFGHRKGAFTGALQDRRGLFEAASSGTIFLDEVGEMPPAMQAKLLRVIQEGEIVPVGDNKPRRVDVRVISATNRDLAAEVARGAFREDLYYRLNVFPIRLPPLRERREDIPLLIDAFVRASAARHAKTVSGVERVALERLVASPWPGNIRQLQNEIERAVALVCDCETISVAHLSSAVAGEGPVPPPSPHAAPLGATNAPRSSTTGEPGASPDAGRGEHAGEAASAATLAPLREARARFELDYIRGALAAHAGNVSQTARALGLSRFMLHKKIKDFGLR